MTDAALPHHRIRQFVIATGGVAVLALVMSMVNRQSAAPVAKADTLIPVSAATVSVQDVDIWTSGVGTVQPLEMVDVKPRVDGQLLELFFHEGDEVKAGQPLARIDPRPFRALYDQAVANRNRDAAQLANSRLDLDRAQQLAKLGAGTGQASDTLRAQVAAQSATVAADDAQIRTAALNLEWTTIRSPIAGRVGLRQVNPGAMVTQSSATGIVTVTQIAPVAAIFTLPQDALGAIDGAGAGAQVTLSTRTGGQDLATGRLTSIDSQVDSTTAQIRVKASFPNADRKLWPGALISARLLAGVRHKVLTIPAAALQQSQTGAFVYVVDAADTVAARPVTAGDTVGDITIIDKGLTAGERVVTSGQSRIAIGSKVSLRATRP